MAVSEQKKSKKPPSPDGLRRRLAPRAVGSKTELVIITGMSGSGKASVLKAFEDMGYYAVDNLPAELMPPFGELIKASAEIDKAALVVDVREGTRLGRLPQYIQQLKKQITTTVLYLEASDRSLIRRFSETRRPHPLGRSNDTVKASLASERRRLDPIRNIADVVIDTSKFNVHELRAHIDRKSTRLNSS